MPKIVDHDERRLDFVSASLVLIASEGLDAVTLKRVAGNAGFTVGAIAHYFESRRDLLVATLRQAHASAGERMARAVSTTANPKDRLRAVLREALPLTAQSLIEWRVWMAFWGAAIGDRELCDEHDLRYEEWRAVVSSLCRDVSSMRGTADRVDYLITLVDGLGLQIALTPSGDTKRLKIAQRRAAQLIADAVDRIADPN